LAILLVVGLSGCGKMPMGRAEEAYDLADAAQANARTALGRSEDFESRISDLEGVKDDLETRISDLETKLEQQRAEFEDYKQDSVQWHHKHTNY